MTMESMQLAWTVYIGGSIVLLALCWWATSSWKPVLLARLVRVWLMILLLVPAYADPENTWLAPAWLVTFFLAANDGFAAARDGYWPLYSAFALATAVLCAGALVQWLRRRQDPTPVKQQGASKVRRRTQG